VKGKADSKREEAMKRKTLCLVLSLLTFLAVQPLFSEPTPLERDVDRYLKPLLDEDLISGSILIARKGKIELSKGYGLANREHNVPCTAETVYRLASVTKTFTAAAVMILQDRGLLKVDDPLSKYIPDYPGGDRITLHHLLNHTAGVINYSALHDHYRVWAMDHTLDQVIDRFKNEPLRFEPGERFEYSNSGYVLLARVIEIASGQSFGDFLKANIFKPLGMTSSGVDSHTKVIPHRATGHYNMGEEIIQAPYLYMEYTSGAGALYSTVEDMYRWDRGLMAGKLLSPEALEKMYTPGQGNYGYGWFVREEFGHRLIEHRGGINGFLTMIQRFIDDDVVVITLFNYVSTFARQVNRDLAAIALGLPVKPVLIPEGVGVEKEKLAELEGTYAVMEQAYTVLMEEGALYSSGPDQPKEKLIPQSEVTFYLRKGNALLHFPRNEAGVVERMIYQQSEHLLPCPKVKVESSGKNDA